MIKRLVLILLPILLVVGLLTAGALWYKLHSPYKGFTTEVLLDIPPGTTTAGIAKLLRDVGAIQSEWQFLAVRALNSGTKLQAGEYKFDRELTVTDVYGKIARGDVFYYELRVPEGSTIFEIAEEVGKLRFLSAKDFLKEARNPALIRDLAPAALSLEGYLFPSTYRITKRTSVRQICREMTGQFRKIWTQIGGRKADVNRTVTLASLVEKETAIPSERPAVASVYSNRLELGMKLDCDPTVIYAALLEGRYRGTIYRSDLDNPHPYNTYRNPGLPPGPIANPGTESMRAALHPAETKYLFFVAKPDGSGGHSFSENLTSHNAAVRAFRSGAN